MKYILTVLAIFVSASLFAQSISESEALNDARTFLHSSDVNGSTLRSLHSNSLSLVKTGMSHVSEDPAYYVFSDEQENGGFVIVSGDSRTSHRILGYSTSGKFRADNMPENMRMWLGEYADQIDAIRGANAVINEGTGMEDAIGNVIVAPLITTQWNQDEPFNGMCPEMNGERSAVGCAAVAVGQIMNYYKWPKQGMGQKEYEWNSSLIKKNFSESKYDYDNLDVAEFLYDVAVGVETKFGIEESSASDINIGKAMMDYFGYDRGLQIHNRHPTVISSSSSQGWSIELPGWSDEDWDNMIRAELDAKRPVLWGAGKGRTGDGHEFICDGYDDAGYFHFNWGWGGYCDGWYVTSSLNPEYANSGYNYNTSIMIDVKPDEGNDQWMGSYGNENYIWGFCDSVYVRYCLENDSTHEKFYAPPKRQELVDGSTVYAKDLDWLPEFPEETIIPDGTYRKYEAYCILGADKYFPVQYGYGEDRNGSYETFKWVDVYNGVWTETSSRTFNVTKDDAKASYYILNDAEVKMIDWVSLSDTLTIDEKVSYRGKEYTVTEIEFNLGSLKPQFPKTIRKMTTTIDADVEANLPEGLEELSLLYQGTQLTLPSSLKVLTLKAFNGTKLTLPSSLEYINGFIASELTELIIPASVRQLPEYDGKVYYTNFITPKLKSVIFEEGSNVKEIPSSLFDGCSQLSNVVFPEEIETIGEKAFCGCDSLKKLELPKSLRKIEKGAFSNCKNLETLLISDDALLEEIDEYAFEGCEKLEHLNFPASLKIMNNPFYSMGLVEVDLSKTHLEDVNLPFDYCQSLTSVILPNGLKSITQLGTGNAKSLFVPQGVETIDGLNGPSLMSVTLPASLTSFCTNGNNSVFASGANVICEASTPPAGCGLTCMSKSGKSYRNINIYIPVGAKTAYEEYSYSPPRVNSKYYYYSPLFEMLKSDTTINVISDEDGLVVMGSSETCGELVIPASVNTIDGVVEVSGIGEYAFSGNANLRVVDIPASVGGMTAIKSRPAGMTLRSASLSGIGSYAFAYCHNLEKVIVHWNNPLEISSDVFEGVDLSKLTLLVPANAVPAYQSAEVWKDFGVISGAESMQDIEDISVTTREQDNVLYNLYGQKVDANYKGVVILGGKKWLISH